MKVNLEIQYQEQAIKYEDMVRMTKADLRQAGYKLCDLEELNLCYNIEDNAVYYTTSLKGNTISNILCL